MFAQIFSCFISQQQKVSVTVSNYKYPTQDFHIWYEELDVCEVKKKKKKRAREIFFHTNLKADVFGLRKCSVTRHLCVNVSQK